MRIRILKIDETEYWSDEIKNRVKRIFGVYVFDPNWRVHCCEFTPSYELHRLDSAQVEFLDDTPEAIIEEVEEEIREAERFDDRVTYIHSHTLHACEHFKDGWFPKGTMGTCTMTGFAKGFDYDPNDPAERSEREQGHDYAIAEALEYCQQACV